MFEIIARELRATLLRNHGTTTAGIWHVPGRVVCTLPLSSGTHPKVARNLTRSFFDIAHKRCNSNDSISMFEIIARELRATLLRNHSVEPQSRGAAEPWSRRAVEPQSRRTPGVPADRRAPPVFCGSAAPRLCGSTALRLHGSAAPRSGSSTMSHVIPLRLFQTLKSSRWNCNVCGLCRKMTVLNYVRLLGECPRKGEVYRQRGRAHARFLQSWSRGSSTMSHVIPLRLFQTLKSSRWNCNVCGLCRKMTVLNYVRLLGE